MFLHPDDIQGADICFLLSVTWEGKDYRFSTVPIDIQDTIQNEVHRYFGGLSDPDITQSSDFTGVDMEADTIAVELVFTGINWVQEWLTGHSLVHSECELSMIAITGEHTTFTEQDRIILFQGQVIEPIIGTPDKPEGHVIFSIENSLKLKKVKLLENQSEITVFKFPGLDQRGTSIGRTISYPIGKYAPFVFGSPGTWIQRTGPNPGLQYVTTQEKNSTGIEFFDVAQVSPAYTINATNLGTINAETTYLIAQGDVASSQVRIWDETGGNFVNTVELEQNEEGQLFSQVKYKLGSVIEDNSFAPALDSDQTFWVSWGEFDGGSVDPISGESLAPSTNLIFFVMDRVGLKYNKAKWMGLANLLNRYKFSGYVNDPQVVALDWLKKNILSYLPIQVFNGDGGYEPRVNLYFYGEQINPSYHLEDHGLFQIVTGIQPLDVDVVNKVVVKFCYGGEFQQYLSTISIDPTLEEETPVDFRDPVSDVSFNRFGLQEEVIECPFIWDLDTAIRVARDRIRTRGLGVYAVEVMAAPQFGYLQVGDVIALTSSNLSLEKHKCQIIQKSWSSNSWRYVIHLESNSLVNPRQLV